MDLTEFKEFTSWNGGQASNMECLIRSKALEPEHGDVKQGNVGLYQILQGKCQILSNIKVTTWRYYQQVKFLLYMYIYTHTYIYIVSFSNFRMSQPYPTMFDYPSYSHLIPFNQIPLNPATAWWITLVALLPRNSAAQRPVGIMASLSCSRKLHGDETWWSNQPYWTSILW